jgi:hypothetical protein
MGRLAVPRDFRFHCGFHDLFAVDRCLGPRARWQLRLRVSGHRCATRHRITARAFRITRWLRNDLAACCSFLLTENLRFHTPPPSPNNGQISTGSPCSCPRVVTCCRQHNRSNHKRNGNLFLVRHNASSKETAPRSPPRPLPQPKPKRPVKPARQDRQHQQRHHVLDHRVHRRPSGVLVRVTHGIAGHRRPDQPAPRGRNPGGFQPPDLITWPRSVKWY